jgi:K+-sensing histidine kinase KdpD
MTDSKRTPEGHAIPATHFAPAGRATQKDVLATVARITNSPVVSAALEAFEGWVAVLNSHRQILAINHAILLALGVEDPAGVLGLRPGEALKCVHAHDHPGGCGTSEACATCGAVIAMVAAQETHQPQTRKCVLTMGNAGASSDHVFEVRCSTLDMEGESLLLISMRDISPEQRRLGLERAFLHDLSNTLTAFASGVELLIAEPSLSGSKLLAQLREAADTLILETKVQRVLCQDNAEMFRLGVNRVLPSEVLSRVESVLSSHRAARNQSLLVELPTMESLFDTDVGLLVRVLVNMVINAFEAGRAGDQVRIGSETVAEYVTFYVWNRQPIPANVAPRIFQRYFSTKSGDGRGVGTYSMKLLGEAILKGSVSFATSEAAGTTFRVTLPRNPSGPFLDFAPKRR